MAEQTRDAVHATALPPDHGTSVHRIELPQPYGEPERLARKIMEFSIALPFFCAAQLRFNAI
jgi:hypothetical protein